MRMFVAYTRSAVSQGSSMANPESANNFPFCILPAERIVLECDAGTRAIRQL